MCLGGVWKVSNRCLEGIRIVSGFWIVFGRCLEGIRRFSGGSPKGVWKVFGRCLEGVWNKNPYPISTGKKGLIFVWRVSGRCLEGVWKVPVRCLKGVWKLSERCVEGVWKVSGGCLEDVRRVSGMCLENVWKISGWCVIEAYDIYKNCWRNSNWYQDNDNFPLIFWIDTSVRSTAGNGIVATILISLFCFFLRFFSSAVTFSHRRSAQALSECPRRCKWPLIAT